MNLFNVRARMIQGIVFVFFLFFAVLASGYSFESGKGIDVDIADTETIDLSNRTTVLIFPGSFEKFVELRYLKLDNNERLHFMPDTPFLVQNNLRMLSLKSCGITEIYNATFSNLPEISILILSNNKISYIDVDAFHNNSALESLFLNNNSIKTLNAHNHLRHLHRISTFNLSGNPIFELQSGAPNYFTSNESLRFVCIFCNLQTVNSGNFNHFTTLRELDLSHNNISNVPRDLLSNLSYVQYVHLSSNPIQIIHLVCNSTLRIYCSNCSISEIGDSLRDVPRLLELDFSHNNITSISGDDFSNNYYLESINLNGNKLLTFPFEIILNLTSLGQLCLDHNRFITNYRNTQLVDIYTNRTLRDLCPKVSVPFEQKLPRIYKDNGTTLYEIVDCPIHEYFSLQNRSIIYIEPQYFQQCDKLRELQMSGNAQFDFVRNQTFLQSSSIEKYRCNLCGITGIYKETFAEMPQLRELSLMYNNISALKDDIFSHNPLLEGLHLDGNSISHFSDRIVETLTHLRHLSLNNNRNFTLSSHRVFLYHAQIERFACNWCAVERLTATVFQFMPNLRELVLSNNRIEAIATDTFQKNAKLRSLSLDGNKLREISSDLIRNLVHFRTLCLGTIPFYAERNEWDNNLSIKKKGYYIYIDHTPPTTELSLVNGSSTIKDEVDVEIVDVPKIVKEGSDILDDTVKTSSDSSKNVVGFLMFNYFLLPILRYLNGNI